MQCGTGLSSSLLDWDLFMKLRLVTTLGRNIGDDFIRIGICNVLGRLFPDVELVAIDKHRPYSVYPIWHPARWPDYRRFQLLPGGKGAFKEIVRRHAHWLKRSLFDDCDGIIQCGAPVVWDGCHRCVWALPLWDQVIGRMGGDVPVLNLAAGASYGWKLTPDTIGNPEDVRFLRRIADY